VVMVRDGMCCLSSDEFFKDDVLALIFNLSVSGFFFKFLCILALLCVCVLRVRFTLISSDNNNNPRGYCPPTLYPIPDSLAEITVVGGRFRLIVPAAGDVAVIGWWPLIGLCLNV